LSENGICVKAGGKPDLPGILQDLLLAPILSRTGSRKSVGFIAKMESRDLLILGDLLQSGKIVPVIDRRYPLSETAEALRYLEQGHAQGKVIITVENR
jgi:NADPH:quinone reductase-like Zn-dependent oxidoreductase